MRTLLAWLLGLAGAAAVAYGTFVPWNADRSAATVPLADLLHGVQREQASLITSLAVPLLLGVVLAVLGLLLSDIALRAGGLVLLLTVVTWTFQYGDLVGLQIGYWNAAFGTLLVLVSAALKR